MIQSNHTASIAIVTYPGAQQSAVLGLCDLFSIANRYSQKHSGNQLSVEQISLQAISDKKSETLAAIILPPSLEHSRDNEEKSIYAWLRSQHSAGAVICSICAGAFWLGHAGLLKGRPATTHWALEDEFRTTFADVNVNTEQLLIDDNDIVTAGGLMAWVDLGLFLVNKWLGPQIVSDTARHLLVDPSGREQRNYRSFRPSLTHGDSAILSLQHWLEANAEMEITVKEMAERVFISDRTFLRRFKAATGMTPLTYLQNLRVEKARGLLERTQIPVNQIGWNVGYLDPSAFSRIFRVITGLTASDYRKRFGVLVRNSHR